jgi:hypothetical protein
MMKKDEDVEDDDENEKIKEMDEVESNEVDIGL